MKMKKCIIISIILTVFCYIFPVFYVVGDSDIQSNVYQNDEEHWYKLTYSVCTGVNWYIEDSSDIDLIGEYVVIKSFADPTLLDDDYGIPLYYTADFYVVSDKKNLKTFEDEKTWYIDAQKIFVNIPNSDASSQKYTLSDIGIYGIIKAFVGTIYPPYKYSCFKRLLL